MRVLCRHGHLAFYSTRAGDVTRFARYYGVELVRVGDFFTFPLLAELPRYSIQGKPFGGIPAVKTYEGAGPWEVMRENGFVYHIASGFLLPKSSIAIPIDPPLVGEYFLAQSPLIQPGSRNASGNQVLGYDAEYVESLLQLRVTEFSYE